MLKIGDKIPALSGVATSDHVIRLRELRGKYVVIYFYPKDNTSGCTREAQDFRDLHKQFTKRDAVVLGISRDSLKSHDGFKSKHKLPFELGPVHSNPRGSRCTCAAVRQGVRSSTIVILWSRRTTPHGGRASTTLRAGVLCPHRRVAVRLCTSSTLRSRRLALQAKSRRRGHADYCEQALIADTDETWCRAFDVIHEKMLYGKRHLGVVRSTFLVGPDSRLRHEWRGVKLPDHVNAVLEALNAESA